MMAHGQHSVDEREQRLDAVVTAYLQELEAGHQPQEQAILAQHPELAVELAQFFEDQRAVGLLAAAPLPQPVVAGLSSDGCLGDFRLVREIGRGGMGVVYEAEQVSLQRRVALKVLSLAAALDSRRLQRFLNEARAAASLHHTNIVPVHAVGSAGGVHFYAMQYIEGQTLAALIRRLRREAGLEVPAELPPTVAACEVVAARRAEAPVAGAVETWPQAGLSTESGIGHRDYFQSVARLGVQLAEALEYAHDMGVIHRDIKPANLLLDGRGTVWITDFGLAQLRQGDTQLTQTGDLLGTLRYMSPEQAQGKPGLLDQRADVYALGATLYELLTLQPVFAGRERQELLRQISQEEPLPPRRWNRPVPVELETIVLKALEKSPADRYATAQALADDLRHWLEDRPIQARRPSCWLQLRRWGRRHRTLVTGAAAALLVGLAVLAGCVGWVARDRATRRDSAAKVIEAALKEASDWQEQGRLPEALSAARRANGLLAGVDANTELAQRVGARLADLELLDRLEQIRLTRATAVKEGHFDADVRDRLYEQEFQGMGVNIGALSIEEMARPIRATSVAVELAAALDDWAVVRKICRGVGDPSWKTLLQVACLADRDGWRVRARRALAAGNNPELRRLMASADAAGVRPATLAALATILQATKDASPEVESLLRAAQRRYPGDFWLNTALSHFYTEQKRPTEPTEGVRFAAAAVSLRPQSPGAHLNLGVALSDAGKLDGAIQEYGEAIRLKGDYAEAHHNLGTQYAKQGRLDDAIIQLREALSLRRDWALAHNNLGVALSKKGRATEAIAEFREAIRLKRDDAMAHSNLGNALHDTGRLDDAIAE